MESISTNLYIEELKSKQANKQATKPKAIKPQTSKPRATKPEATRTQSNQTRSDQTQSNPKSKATKSSVTKPKRTKPKRTKPKATNKKPTDPTFPRGLSSNKLRSEPRAAPTTPSPVDPGHRGASSQPGGLRPSPTAPSPARAALGTPKFAPGTKGEARLGQPPELRHLPAAERRGKSGCSARCSIPWSPSAAPG